MRYFSTFSGIEAASVAWHNIPGWKPVGFSEIEPFPSAVLAHRFPHVKNYGDITKYKEWDIKPGDFDLLVGGSPCQAFSVAGLRKGLADPRGNLALVFLGMADHFKPKWILWENVPGVLSSNGGRDLGSFLGALAEIGYGACYRILDAQHFGVAQRRRRIFLVGHLGDWRPAAEVLLEPESLPWNTPQGDTKGQGAAPSTKRGARGNGGKGAGNSGGELELGLGGSGSGDRKPNGGVTWPAEKAASLTASFGNDQGIDNQHINQGAPHFVPQHQEGGVIGTLCARDSKGVGNQYVQEGKCIPCREVPQNWNGAQVANTITTRSHNQSMPDKDNFGGVLHPSQGLSEATPEVFRKSDPA